MRESGRKASRRSYRPKVEALEALRMLDAGLLPAVLTGGLAEVGLPTLPEEPSLKSLAPHPAEAAWDAALGESEVGVLLGRGSEQVFASLEEANTEVFLKPEALRQGLDQLTRYLGRAWARAGIEPGYFEDCTQEVYETLLSHLGRDGFDLLVVHVSQHGVSTVLNRETPDGPDFFRAVDMVKKRTQRIKTFQSLDDHHREIADAAGGDGASAMAWRRELDEAIVRSLNPREASLIRATLEGKTPQEIATDWGVAPKTVSNEKTRAIQKLRDALTADLEN